MKAKIIIIFLFLLSVFASAIGEEWEGTVAMAQYGEFPANGFYGASNAFPRNTIVEVKNSKNGKTVTLIIISRLEQEGLFMLVSREAAQGLGFNADEIIRADITIVAGAGQQFGTMANDLPVSPDPDINPAASAADVEDSIYQRAMKNLRDRYALSPSKYQPDTTVEDTTPEDTTPEDTTPDDHYVQDTGIEDDAVTTDDTIIDQQPDDTLIVEHTPVPDEPDHGTVKTTEETGPEILTDGSRNPDGSAADNLVAEEPPLPDDFPEINTGFVKAGDYDRDSLVAMNPAEPEYDTEEETTVVVVEDRPEPEDFGPEPRYSDFDAKPSEKSREELDGLALNSPETGNDNLLMSDIYANPTAKGYDFSAAAIAVPETDDELVFADAFAEPGAYSYNFEEAALAAPVDPSEAGKEFLVDDSSAKPLVHDNRNFDNLAAAVPIVDKEDKAVYDSLFVKTPKQAEYHAAAGQMPPDPYAMQGADTLAASPIPETAELLVQHDPELEGMETPTTIDSLAAIPGIKAAPLLAVEMEPETPEALSQDALTYDSMLASPLKGGEDFAEGPEPDLPGDNVEAEDMTYVMRDSDDTFDAALSDLPREPGEEVVEQIIEEDDTVVENVPEDTRPNATESTVMLVPSDKIRGNNVSGPLPEGSGAKESVTASVEEGDLKKGNEYLQLAVFSDQDSVMKIYDEYSPMFPVTVLVSGTKSGKNYKVLIGPLGPDESGAILHNFKRRGYKDAFLRKE